MQKQSRLRPHTRLHTNMSSDKHIRIKFLKNSDIGKWVTYRGGAGEVERGKLLSFDNGKRRAFVVYHANGNWDGDHWKDYTAASTDYFDLSWG